MKFPRFREFRSGSMEAYLGRDLAYNLRELFTGLRRLTFTDNFDAFIVDVTIASGAEVTLANELTDIPRGKIVIRDYGNAGFIADGDTEWTRAQLSLKNIGATETRAQVLFFR